MERMTIESINNEISPEVLGNKFNAEDFSDFIDDLRRKIKSNPSMRFTIVADWAGVEKARSAKALLDDIRCIRICIQILDCTL